METHNLDKKTERVRVEGGRAQGICPEGLGQPKDGSVYLNYASQGQREEAY